VYKAIIARNLESPRGASAAGFLFAFPPSDGGRTSRRLISPHLACASGASRRPSPDQHVTGRCARTRRPCGEPLRRMRPLRLRDTVRAGNDRTRPICRHFLFGDAGDRLSDLAGACRPRRHRHVGFVRVSRAKTLTEIRSIARSHTRTAVKLLIWDKVLGLGTTDPLAGFAAVTSNLVVSFYFAKRGFENVARIIRR
jgi:hypothetical protein